MLEPIEIYNRITQFYDLTFLKIPFLPFFEKSTNILPKIFFFAIADISLDHCNVFCPICLNTQDTYRKNSYIHNNEPIYTHTLPVLLVKFSEETSSVFRAPLTCGAYIE